MSIPLAISTNRFGIYKIASSSMNSCSATPGGVAVVPDNMTVSSLGIPGSGGFCSGSKFSLRAAAALVAAARISAADVEAGTGYVWTESGKLREASGPFRAKAATS